MYKTMLVRICNDRKNLIYNNIKILNSKYFNVRVIITIKLFNVVIITLTLEGQCETSGFRSSR